MFSKNEDEMPTKKLLAELKKSEAGGVIRFKNKKEMFAHLDKMIEKDKRKKDYKLI